MSCVDYIDMCIIIGHPWNEQSNFLNRKKISDNDSKKLKKKTNKNSMRTIQTEEEENDLCS